MYRNILCYERTGLSFRIAAAPRQTQSFSGPSPAEHNHILLSRIRDSLNLEGQVSVYISPRNRLAR
jgi:hypothetical protein